MANYSQFFKSDIKVQNTWIDNFQMLQVIATLYQGPVVPIQIAFARASLVAIRRSNAINFKSQEDQARQNAYKAIDAIKQDYVTL